MQTPSPEWVRSLRPYVPGKPVEEVERELGITGSIKLASNENPLGASPRAIAAAAAALQATHIYPDASAFRLRGALADRAGVHADRVVVGNGSDQIVNFLVRAFTTPADNVVFGEVAFVAYRIAAQAHGAQVRATAMPQLRHDVGAMVAACDAHTRLLFVANPNNPTGTSLSRDELLRLLRDTPPHVMVVLDEAYTEYADEGEHVDGLELLGERANLVVMRTFSKAYGLAALRVGWAVMPAYAADLCNRIREPFHVNSIAQAAALAALEDASHVARTVEVNAAVRESLCAQLDTLGLDYVRGQTNFVLVRSPIGGAALTDGLLRRGVIIRPLANYGLHEHVRISLGTPEENERLVAALREVLA
jgi:histidinol-phosphate aminotransferase